MGLSTGMRATLALATLAAAALCARTTPADEPRGVPEAGQVRGDETAGRFEAALDGWARRALEASVPADRREALRCYVDLAAKHPAEGEPWLLDALARSGPGFRVLAGRRVVAVVDDSVLAGADAARIAALLDASELAVERIAGVRPAVVQLPKEDKHPRDAAGRFLVRVGRLPKPLEDQVFDGALDLPDAAGRGPALVGPFASLFSSHALGGVANRRASRLGAAVPLLLADLAVREVGEPAAVAKADEQRVRAKESYETQWLPGCLPAESMSSDETLLWLLVLALEAERAGGRDPADAWRAFLATNRREPGWRHRVASARDLGFESLAAALGPAACEVLRGAGVLPSGRAFDEMRTRVSAEDLCREADELAGTEATRGPAASNLRAAAQMLGASVAADEVLVGALQLEERDDAKKARAAVKRLAMIEGFDFLGPLPGNAPPDDVPWATRLMPLAVATAPSRHPLKMKEPVDVSLKWEEVKEVGNPLVQHTPWGDKRRITWGGAALAAIRWPKEAGRLLRLRPMREDGEVAVLCDGRPCERWPDGSVLVSGAKGIEVLLASAGRITCAVPWRDATAVEADLAAAAAEKDGVAALRPWAARRIQIALPAVVAAVAALPDAAAAPAMKLLAPYRGGDAAACDTMLARVRDKPALLAAYLESCAGSRDVALIDRMVALAAAPDASAEVVTRVQRIVAGALFRRTAEKGADLASVWERGRKWLASAAFAEAEEVRDLCAPGSCFRAVADADACGRACLAPSGGRGEGYLAMDVPEGGGAAFLAVRWRGPANARLVLKGVVTDGKKPRPFAIDVPVPTKTEWTLDVFELGSIPRGRVVFAFDDLCAGGCTFDCFAVGAKPLE